MHVYVCACVGVCFNDDSVYMWILCVLALNGGRERAQVEGWGEGNGGWFVCGPMRSSFVR